MEDKNNTTIYIGNITSNITEKEIYECFLTFGEINQIKLKQNKEGKKNYAFIKYEEEDDAKQAILNMNQTEFYGNYIYVSYQRMK